MPESTVVKTPPCVVIDVGNTSTSIGRYENGAVSAVTAIKGGIRDPQKCEEALCAAGVANASRAVLASVVPFATPTWKWLVSKLFGLDTVVLDCTTPLPIGIRYPKPETIGPDRLANACGAAARYGAPAIVADFGTALTFDILSSDSCYIGGVIAPGLPLMTDYLHEKTALLPRIDLEGDCAPIGTSTENAMRIGARIGHRGMVREVVHHLERTTGTDVKLCATGGYAHWALDGLDMPFQIDTDLTLFGLGVVHDFELRSRV